MKVTPLVRIFALFYKYSYPLCPPCGSMPSTNRKPVTPAIATEAGPVLSSYLHLERGLNIGKEHFWLDWLPRRCAERIARGQSIARGLCTSHTPPSKMDQNTQTSGQQQQRQQPVYDPNNNGGHYGTYPSRACPIQDSQSRDCYLKHCLSIQLTYHLYFRGKRVCTWNSQRRYHSQGVVCPWSALI